MEWLPAVSAEVTRIAVEPETVAVPRVEAPSRNVTVPLGEEPPDNIAVNVTDWPAAGEVNEADSAIEGETLATVTVTAPEVAAALLLSPP